MAFKPLRLKRTLAAITGDQWQFALNAGGYVEYDDTITSVSINRGVSGRNLGHNPNTCEIQIEGRKDAFTTGGRFRFFLRASVAQALAAFVGSTAAAIEERFDGRLSTVQIEDLGGDKFYSTIAGSSYLTQMNYSPASFTPGAGQELGSVLAAMSKANEPIRGVEFFTNLGNVNIHQFATGEPMLFSDGVGAYAEEIGVTLQERRGGQTYVLGIEWRKTEAAARAITDLPLMRNQAIAPGEYMQANDRPAVRVEFQIINEAGFERTRVAEVANPTGELVETVKHDWRRFQIEATANQLNSEAYAQVFGSSARLYTLPTVKVDMLMLLRNGGEYARGIAKQILELEVSQPIFLSGDWPPKLQGVHFAEGIKEQITPTSWEFELSLIPHAAATGATSPEVKPRAWDSFTYDWDSETRAWDGA